MVFGLLSPYNGNPLFLQTTRPLHNYPSHVLCTYYRQSRTLTGKISTLPNSLVVTSLDFYGEPTALFYDLGLGHLRMLGARIISNDGPRLSNFYAADWTATSAKGVLEQQIQFISCKWIEEPAKLTEEIALNPTWFRCGTSRSRARNHGCDDQAIWGLEEGWWGRSETRPRGRERERLSEAVLEIRTSR